MTKNQILATSLIVKAVTTIAVVVAVRHAAKTQQMIVEGLTKIEETKATFPVYPATLDES